MDTHSGSDHPHSLSTCKRIRFFEYASLIPNADPESPQEQYHPHYFGQSIHNINNHNNNKDAHNNRPRLCARTYSVPIPTSLTSIFSSPPPSEFKNDPSFFPNSPPKLSLKVPSFTRRRRYTVANPENLKSCLKKKAHNKAVAVNKSTTSNNASGNPPKSRRANSTSSYLDGSGTASSSKTANAPLQSPPFNPIYCPALAKVLAASAYSSASSSDGKKSVQSHSSPPASNSALSTSSSSTSSLLATSPPTITSSSANAVPSNSRSPSHQAPSPNTSDDLLPVRECCRACFRATAYGERCSDKEYHEKWSKNALEKRKRDEEILFERGEYSFGGGSKNKISHGLLHHPHHESHSKHSSVIGKDQVEQHHSSSASTSPTAFSSSSSGNNKVNHKEEGKHCLNISNVLHCNDDAQHEAKVEECKGAVDELDLARKRLCKLDLGGGHSKRLGGSEEEKNKVNENENENSPIESEDGDDLDMEGIDETPKKVAAAESTSGSSLPPSKNHSTARRSRTGTDASTGSGSLTLSPREEKNPICQLSGSVLVPCSSRSIYTGVDTSSSRPRSGSGGTGFSDIPPGLMLNIGTMKSDHDAISNASSSDLSSDELANSLAPLTDTPGSVATTVASSWLPDDLDIGNDGDDKEHSLGNRLKLDFDLDSPVVEKSAQESRQQQSQQSNSPPSHTLSIAPVNGLKSKDYGSSAPSSTSKPACSPLMRSKGCIRPTGLYTDPILEENEVVKIKGGFDSDNDEEENKSEKEGRQITEAAAKEENTAINTSTSKPSKSAAEKEAELAEALKEADKPLFPNSFKREGSNGNNYSNNMSKANNSRPVFGRSRSSGSGVHEDRAGSGGVSSSTSLSVEQSGGGGRPTAGKTRQRSSSMGWTAKLMHPGRMLSSFGPSHGMVH